MNDRSTIEYLLERISKHAASLQAAGAKAQNEIRELQERISRIAIEIEQTRGALGLAEALIGDLRGQLDQTEQESTANK